MGDRLSVAVIERRLVRVYLVGYIYTRISLKCVIKLAKVHGWVRYGVPTIPRVPGMSTQESTFIQEG